MANEGKVLRVGLMSSGGNGRPYREGDGICVTTGGGGGGLHEASNRASPSTQAILEMEDFMSSSLSLSLFELLEM
jgi:hypothetical protein